MHVSSWGKKRHSKALKVGEGIARSSSKDSYDGVLEDGSEEGLTFYPLMAAKEKRLLKDEAKLGSTGHEKRSIGELACDVRLTSAEPRPLPVQGEAKFSLRCRIWEMCGVTSPEERNLMAINGTVARHKAVLRLYENYVSSEFSERSKDKEKRTPFNGSMISLDTKANMATDMLKFVVKQRVSPVELGYKPVATVSIPLRSIPVLLPGAGSDQHPDSETTLAAAVATNGGRGGGSGGGGAQGGAARGDKASFFSGPCHLLGGGGGDGKGGKGMGAPDPGQVQARRYRLQTLAGPLTNRTMDNGFVVLSLALVPSGNDLLGEPDPEDSEDVKVPPPPPPKALENQILDASINCGYQRLRKALLWNDSKLQDAFADLLNYSDITRTPWLDQDGEAGHQENLTGCTRDRTFVIPKSAMVASTTTEAHDVILADGPSLMAYEERNRTPGVSFGDKFVVAVQFVVIKEGPDKCRLQSSSEAIFSDKVMGFVQGQIVSFVSKVSKENHHRLLELIQDALSGKGAGGGGGAVGRGGKGKSSRHACWFWRLAGLALTAGGALWARDYFSVGSGGVLNGSVMRQRLTLPISMSELSFKAWSSPPFPPAEAVRTQPGGAAGEAAAAAAEADAAAACSSGVSAGGSCARTNFSPVSP